MAVVTEASLRDRFRDADLGNMSTFRVAEGTVVTPSAQAWLMDHKIDLVVGDEYRFRVSHTGRGTPIRPATAVASGDGPTTPEQSALPAFTKPDRYQLAGGGSVAEKPEHMTALRGNLLVAKDHPVIALRGRLDSLEADILLAQVALRRLGLDQGVAQLGEVLQAVKRVMRAEVLEEPLEPLTLWGLDAPTLRHRSHHPAKTYGVVHFAASVDDGEAVCLLNALRTRAREVELAAFAAFCLADGSVSRPDIIEWLNRLSSAFYLLMFKAKTGNWD
jgi:ethanolamine utilization cobalamin adenosyltransferase